jgi:hypothetical protein
MLEVNDIYKDLAGLVADQGSQLHSIEANINATDSRVEHGLGDLVSIRPSKVSLPCPE